MDLQQLGAPFAHPTAAMPTATCSLILQDCLTEDVIWEEAGAWLRGRVRVPVHARHAGREESHSHRARNQWNFSSCLGAPDAAVPFFTCSTRGNKKVQRHRQCLTRMSSQGARCQGQAGPPLISALFTPQYYQPRRSACMLSKCAYLQHASLSNAPSARTAIKLPGARTDSALRLLQVAEYLLQLVQKVGLTELHTDAL